MRFLAVFACMIVLALQSSADNEIREQLKNSIRTRVSQADIKNAAETCLSENNMTIDDWFSESDIMTGVYAEPENAQKKRNNGCAFACVLKKLDFMDESNKIKESNVHVYINTELANTHYLGLAHKIARKCMKEVRSIVEECDKSFSLYACLCKQVHKVEEHEEHERETVNESNSEQEENNSKQEENSQ